MNLRIVAACAALAALVPRPSLAEPTRPRPSETVLTFHNQLPKKFRLTHMRLVVDGTVRYDGPAFGTAYLAPGRHVVELVADYRMHNPVLTYLDGYRVQVRSAHVVEPRRSGRVAAVALPNGGATTPLDRSAVIDWVDH